MSYSSQGSKEPDITERLTHTHTHTHTHTCTHTQTHTHTHPYLCIYYTEGTSLLVCPLDYELPEGRDCVYTAETPLPSPVFGPRSTFYEHVLNEQTRKITQSGGEGHKRQ